MVLVDTSVWIGHLRKADSLLVELLEAGDVAVHPFVIGELACGNLKNRGEILSLLRALPSAAEVSAEEVLIFIEGFELMGHGLGWIDVHLLASCRLGGHALWTRDKRLANAAESLDVKLHARIG